MSSPHITARIGADGGWRITSIMIKLTIARYLMTKLRAVVLGTPPVPLSLDHACNTSGLPSVMEKILFLENPFKTTY